MTGEPAALGGNPAVTIDHARCTQWPIYTEEEVEAVADLIRSHALSSSQGEKGPITELEQRVAETWGVRRALAHSSGTAALRSALFGVGVAPGDEVICQSAVHPRRGLKVVEDCAVSQGTTHRGRMGGSIGHASALSFQHGKLTSAGEGGLTCATPTTTSWAAPSRRSTASPHRTSPATSPRRTTAGASPSSRTSSGA